MSIIIDKTNIIIELGQVKHRLLHDDTCEILALRYLFTKGKFGYRLCRDIPLSVVNTLIKKFFYEHCHFHSSISFAICNIKACQLVAGTMKQNYKGTNR